MSNYNKKILVTGSAGLIGRCITSLLKNKGFYLIGLDNNYYHDHDDYGNILDKKILKKKIKQCHGIIHLAAVSRVISGQQNPKLCKLVNIEGTKNIVEIAASCKMKPWLIYASSREVYGQQSLLPAKEDSQLLPVNVYAYSKVKAESIVTKSQEMGLKTSILRFSNVFGDVEDYFDRVIPAFCINALNDNILNIEGGDNTFDFTYVKDIGRGIYLTVESLLKNNKNIPPIHLTNGVAITLNEAAKIIKKITNSKSKNIECAPRNFDVAKFFGDNGRARDILNWSPEYSFSDAIKIYTKELSLSMKNLKQQNNV